MKLCPSYTHYRSSGAYELPPFKLKSPRTRFLGPINPVIPGVITPPARKKLDFPWPIKDLAWPLISIRGNVYLGKPRPGAWAWRQEKGLETPEPESYPAAWQMPRAHLLLQWVGTPGAFPSSPLGRCDWLPIPPGCCCYCVVAKSSLTLCEPVDGSPPGSSVHGISQPRILGQLVIPFSRASAWSWDRTCVCRIGRSDSLPLSHWGSPPYRVAWESRL